MPIPSWLHNSVITTMGPLKKYSNIKFLFSRPTFSHMLLDIIRHRDEQHPFPKEKSFGFEPEITIKLAKKKSKFFEVPISYNGRSYSEGKKIGLKDAFIAVYCIFKYSLTN